MLLNPQPVALLDEGSGDFIDAEFTEELALPGSLCLRRWLHRGSGHGPSFSEHIR